MYQETQDIVTGFVKAWASFTALDISNEVKKILPSVRHRDIAEEVRNIFGNGITDYMTSQIEVVLQNGDTTIATLYHPVFDEDVLDLTYPIHRRTLIATKPASEPTAEDLVYEMIKESGDQGMFAYTIRFKMSDLHDVDAFETQQIINDLLAKNKIKANDDGTLHIFDGVVSLSASLKPVGKLFETVHPTLADEDELQKPTLVRGFVQK